jgi:hypothetical protein
MEVEALPDAAHQATIDTTNGSYRLTQFDTATELNVVGYNVDRHSAPFVFPHVDTFATLFPQVTTIFAWQPAVEMTTFLSAIGGLLRNLEKIEYVGDWGDFPDAFRITRDVHIDMLGRIVANAPRLTTLSLEDGILTARNTVVFTNALAVNTTITYLNLTRSSCGLDEIAHVLRTNRTITHLVIDHLQNDDDGSVTQVLAANMNPVLCSLSFVGANIVHLADGMRTNTTLGTLITGPLGEEHDDVLTEADADAINDMLSLNRTLTSLTLNGSEGPMVDYTFTALAQNHIIRSFVLTNFDDEPDDEELVVDGQM